MKRNKSLLSTHRKAIYLGLGIAILAGAFFYLKNLLTISPQISQVIESSTCVSNVEKFTVRSECAPGTFASYSVSCKNGQSTTTPTSSSCHDYFTAYQMAQKFCGQTCTQVTPPSIPPSAPPSTRPSPLPSSAAIPPSPPQITLNSAKPSSTPIATAVPSPLVSCATEVYKLPAKLNVTSLTSSTLSKYLVKGSNIKARAGDRFAFNMKFTNLSSYPLVEGNLGLSTWTLSTSGENAPYNILSPASSCQIYPDKSIRCGVSQLSIGPKLSTRPDTFVVVNISPVKESTPLDFTYQGTYSASSFDCAPAHLTVQAAKVRKCYGWGRFQWCRYVVAN